MKQLQVNHWIGILSVDACKSLIRASVNPHKLSQGLLKSTEWSDMSNMGIYVVNQY